MVGHAAALPFTVSHRTDRSGRRLMASLSASAGVHGAALLTLWILVAIGWLQGPKHPVKRDVALRTVTTVDWEKNRHVGAPLPKLPRTAVTKTNPSVEPARHEPEPLPKGQVVDVAQGNDEKPDANAKYLAEHNNRVAKETRARDQTAFYGKAMPHQTTNQPEVKAKDEKTRLRGNQGTGKDDGAKRDKTQVAMNEIPAVRREKEVAKLQQAEDGEVRTPAPTHGSQGNSFRLRLRPPGLLGSEAFAGSEGRAGTPDAPDQASSSATQDKDVGAAPNDALQGVEVGDGTFLNTREFKYASFFNRVKQAVAETWRPTDALRKADPQGRRYGTGNHTTVLDVALDADGNLVEVVVAQHSGIDVLDEEAIAAFQRAQPFLHPPEAMLDRSNQIHFQFGFFLEGDGMRSAFSWRPMRPVGG